LSVAISSSFPLDRDNQFLGDRPVRFQVEGDPRPDSESPPITTIRSATSDYFKTLSIQLWKGRVFRDSDDAQARPVIAINHVLAVKRWGTEDPVGKRITIDNGHTWLTIIGVVGDVKEFALDRDTPYQIYRPFAQAPIIGSVLVRVNKDLPGMQVQIRRVLHEVEPQLAIVRVETMEQARAHSVASPRNTMNLFGLLAVLALVIAVFGIGSMLSLWIRQRTLEIGIRTALGATAGNIIASILGEGMLLAVTGLTMGLAVSLALTRLLESFLFHVKPTDYATYLSVSVLLLSSAFIACYVPARRVAAMDPNATLHSH
jgi:putative ABC transport system permease protein